MARFDIDIYITLALENVGPRFTPIVASRVKEWLTNSNGMFLGVRLMLQYIKLHVVDEELMQCLDKPELPKELSKLYDCFLEDINNQEKPRRLLAHKISSWISVARRPLQVKEVCGLLDIKPAECRE